MSTNKTQHYHLHAWEAGDDFLRTEINENFAAVEEAITGKATLVTGSYVGDGTSIRVIDLGRPIKALLLESTAGTRLYNGRVNGGLVLPDGPLDEKACAIVGTTFVLNGNGSFQSNLNIKGNTIYYIAWVEA